MGARSGQLAQAQQRRALSEVFDVLLATVLYTKSMVPSTLPPERDANEEGIDGAHQLAGLGKSTAVPMGMGTTGGHLPGELRWALEASIAAARGDADAPALFAGTPTARASVAFIAVSANAAAAAAAAAGAGVGAAGGAGAGPAGAAAAEASALQDGGLLSRAHVARGLAAAAPAVAAAVAAAAVPPALSPLPPLAPAASSSSSASVRSQSPLPVSTDPLMEASAATRWTLKITVGNDAAAGAGADGNDVDHATETTLTATTGGGGDLSRPPRTVQVVPT